ncbi:hypothetical protein HNR06_002596 [Nocardiopsis arvandica]|uniref:Uncharacterized protein n=1 Tax=Nocardiopsis sinuspersici TaxID=501010 RepID=A0A7Y9XDR1_9ACTN|nr:hypothetical protein [Nocardiopsis sinuspersici]NYH53007.1 hypothetical protein [Nocardiopsis sinuspersici]
MSSENKGEQHGSSAHGMLPVPPGMDLMEYLDLREKAESYIRMVGYLYVDLAFHEENPEQKEKFEKESKRHSTLLKSMKWMNMEAAKPIVAEYPELIRRLREKVKGSDA